MGRILVRRILPPKFIDTVFMREYRAVIQKVAKRSRSRFQDITKDWKNKVTWRYRTEQRKNFIRFSILAEGDKGPEILRYWNYGVKRHIIRPRKRGGWLAFHWPKGESIGIEAPKTSDGRFLFKQVNHPGQKGHHEIEVITLITEEELYINLVGANMRAVKACGHMIK